jgi:hypothetical protein
MDWSAAAGGTFAKKKRLLTLFGRLRQGETRAEFPVDAGLFSTGVNLLEPVELTFCSNADHSHFPSGGLAAYPSTLPYEPVILQRTARPVPLVHRRRTIYQVEHLDQPQLSSEPESRRSKRSADLPEPAGSAGSLRKRREDPEIPEGGVHLQAGWTSYRIPLRPDELDQASVSIGSLVSKLSGLLASVSAGCASLYGPDGLGSVSFVPSAAETRSEGKVQFVLAPRTRLKIRDPDHLRTLGFTQAGALTAFQRPGPKPGDKIISYYLDNPSWSQPRTVVGEKTVRSGLSFSQAYRQFRKTVQDPRPESEIPISRFELELELLSASAELVVDYSELKLPAKRASVAQQLIDGLLLTVSDLLGLNSDYLYFSKGWPRAVSDVPGSYQLSFPKLKYGDKFKNVLTVRLNFGRALAGNLGIGEADRQLELSGRTSLQLTLADLEEAGEHDPALALVLNAWPRGGTPKGSLASASHERMKALTTDFQNRRASLLAVPLVPEAAAKGDDYATASEGDSSFEESVARSHQKVKEWDEFAKKLAEEFARQEREKEARPPAEPPLPDPTAAAAAAAAAEGQAAEEDPGAAEERPGQAQEGVDVRAQAEEGFDVRAGQLEQEPDGEQLLLEAALEAFESVEVPNPEIRPASHFTLLRTDYPGRCSVPEDFPKKYSLLLCEGEPLDFVESRGYLSLLGLMAGSKPSFVNGAILKNLQNARLLHIEILDQSQYAYRLPVSSPYNPDLDGFLILTVLCQPVRQ